MVKGNSYKRVIAALLAMAIVISSLLSVAPFEVKAATNEYFTGTKDGTRATTEPTMYYKKTMVDSSSGSNVMYWAKDTHPSLSYTPPVRSSTGLSARLANGKIGHNGSWGNGLWLASRPSIDELFSRFSVNKDNYENAQFTNFGMATSDKVGMRCSGYGGNTWFHGGLAGMEVYVDVFKVEQVNDTKQLITFRMYANDGGGRGQTSEGYFQIKVDVPNELDISVSFHKKLSGTATDGKTTEDILGNKFDVNQDKSGYGFQIFKLNEAGIEALDDGVTHDMDEDGNLMPADYTKIFDYIEKNIFEGNGPVSGKPNPSSKYFTQKFSLSTGSDGYTDPINLETTRSDIYVVIEHSTPEGVSRGWNNLNDLKSVGEDKQYFYQIFTVIGTKQEDLKVYYKDGNGKLFTDNGAADEEADASLHITDQPIITDFKAKKIFKEATYNAYGHNWSDFSYLLADNKEFKNAKVIPMTGEMTSVGPVFSNQTYYIKENPEAKAVVDGVGFKANPQVYHFETRVNGGVYYSLKVKDNLWDKNATDAENREYIAVEFGGIVNEPKTSKAKIIKVSADENISKDNDCYSLEGAVFELTHVSLDKVYELKTDKEGFAEADVYVGEYKVKETKAPRGFLLNTDIPNITVKEGVVAEIKVADIPAYDNVGMTIYKKDSGTTLAEPLGNATFADAEFTVKYWDNLEGKTDGNPKKTWILVTDENGRIAGFNETTIKKEGSDEPYLNMAGKISLPIGTYAISESKAPRGYLISDKVSVQVLDVDKSMMAVTVFSEVEVPEVVIRGDFEFVKMVERTQEKLANVPFEIKSLTTGEAHIIVTDKNGFASTASKWNLHSQNTNAGQTSDDGVWFGMSTSGISAEIDDSLGALPYDDYTLTELPCVANEGLVLAPPINFTVVRDGVIINGGMIINYERKVDVATEFLSVETRSHEVVATGNQEFIDYVTADGLEVGNKYVLEAKLMVKGQDETDEGSELIIDGKPVTGKLEFIADATKMKKLEVKFTFDTTELAGKRVVAFERLSVVKVVDDKEELVPVGSHEDINDEGQTITISEAPTITPTLEPREDTPKEETRTASSPKTGDNSLLFMYLIILTMAMVILVAMAFKKK